MIYSHDQVAIFPREDVRHILTTRGLPGGQGAEFRALPEFRPLPRDPRCIIIGCWDLSTPSEDRLASSVESFPISIRADDGAVIGPPRMGRAFEVLNTSLSAFLDFLAAFDAMAPFPTDEDEAVIAEQRLRETLVRIDPSVVDMPEDYYWPSLLGDVYNGYLHWNRCGP